MLKLQTSGETMKYVFFTPLWTALILHAFSAHAVEEKWIVDADHSTVSFAVRHMMISNVTGNFTRFKGSVVTDPKHLSHSRIEAKIEVKSINTRNEKRDQHLKGPDFFDAEKYPTITFISKKVKPVVKGKLKITGDLKIRDVTKTVILDVEGPTKPVKGMDGKPHVGLRAQTVINRKDFGLTWNKVLEAGTIVVGDKVQITLNLELVKE